MEPRVGRGALATGQYKLYFLNTQGIEGNPIESES